MILPTFFFARIFGFPGSGQGADRVRRIMHNKFVGLKRLRNETFQPRSVEPLISDLCPPAAGKIPRKGAEGAEFFVR